MSTISSYNSSLSGSQRPSPFRQPTPLVFDGICVALDTNGSFVETWENGKWTATIGIGGLAEPASRPLHTVPAINVHQMLEASSARRHVACARRTQPHRARGFRRDIITTPIQSVATSTDSRGVKGYGADIVGTTAVDRGGGGGSDTVAGWLW
jgi:hypothetical protein